MIKSSMNPKVDWYFLKNKNWQEEIETLRMIVLDCGLEEKLKWGCPCYTLDGNNIVLIHVFKEYCAFLFFKGVLLQDPKRILTWQTANVQAARQIRFSNTKQIIKMKSILRSYIMEAVQLEKKGSKVEYKKTNEFTMPDEFENKLAEVPELKKAFFALTPGRQRGYLLHFSSEKRTATREARIEKYTKQILNGKGLDD